jgi:hypothetical protein
MAASGWDQLAGGITLPLPPGLEIPTLHEVSLPTPRPEPVADVEAVAHAAVVKTFEGKVSGKSVAVGAGSRGLSGRVASLRGTVSALRALGANPFVVPAMGSHAGGTADGQRDLLAALGIDEASID